MTTDDEKRRQELWDQFSKTRGGGKPKPKPAPAEDAPKKPQQR